jgi:hypothetical protein
VGAFWLNLAKDGKELWSIKQVSYARVAVQQLTIIAKNDIMIIVQWGSRLLTITVITRLLGEAYNKYKIEAKLPNETDTPWESAKFKCRK